MKRTIMAIKPFLLLVMAALLQTAVWAQDSSSTSVTKMETSSTTTETTDWYTQPWVWVVGGAVFLLLLIALIRGNSSNKSSTHVSKTVRTNRDV